MDFIPEKSEIQIENIEIHRDPVLKSLIKDLGVRKLIPGMQADKRQPRVQKWAKSICPLSEWARLRQAHIRDKPRKSTPDILAVSAMFPNEDSLKLHSLTSVPPPLSILSSFCTLCSLAILVTPAESCCKTSNPSLQLPIFLSLN